jgi:carbamoyltransferase
MTMEAPPKKVLAADALFQGGRPRQTGRGIHILLLDVGMPDGHDFGGRLRRTDSTPGSAVDDSHAYRGASICAEGTEAAALAEGALGVASEALLLCSNFRALNDEYGGHIRDVAKRLGPIHVVGCPFSGLESYGRLIGSRVALTAATEDDHGPVVVAAVGHDGAGVIRFPAAAPATLSVGVADADCQPSRYCGRDAERRAPALMIPDGAYKARLPDGSVGDMKGTSAAVNVVAGLAALWTERLLENREPTLACVLRAVLLATSKPSAHKEHRMACGEALTQNLPLASHYSDITSGDRLVLEVEATGDAPLAIAAVPRYRTPSGLWIDDAATVSLSAGTAGDVGPWAILDLPAGHHQIELVLEGPVVGVAVAAKNAKSIQRKRASRPKKSRIVVGIAGSHDASACVIRDGRLECAIQLERISRIKHEGKPYLHSRAGIDYVLGALNVQERDVDLFAYNLQSLVPGYHGLSQPLCDDSFDVFDPLGERALFVSHHLAHAFGAFFASPFERSAVFIADGSGGSVVGADDLLLRGPELKRYLQTRMTERPPLHVQSTYVFDRSGYKLVDREYAPSFNTRCGSASLGETYAAVSQYVFDDWQEGGKLMGLAPYGSADEYGPSLLERDANGRLQFASDWKERHRQVQKKAPVMSHRHLAARVQRDLEEALIDRMRTVLDKTGLTDVAYSGGIALNSVANQRMLEETSLGRLFMLPASSDAGISIGAAAAGEYVLTGNTERAPVVHDFLGYPYRQRDIDAAITELQNRLVTSDYDVADVAARLQAGQVVGWFEGGSEFGPRALGHRSLMASPFEKKMWDYLNEHIKFREEFRPYAPIVPREVADKYFEMGKDVDSPYMLRVVRVRPEYRARLGAITHVDGSARVQTVDPERTPRWHRLLHVFGEKTGIPVLVNTSMNVRGEPIVETPMDALKLLLVTHVNAVVLGERVVETRPIPDATDAIDDVKIALAPKVQIRAVGKPGVPKVTLSCSARGKFQMDLPFWAFLLLSNADGKSTVEDLLTQYVPEDVWPEAQALIRDLWKKRLLSVVAG